MATVLKVIYEGGVLKPEEPVELEERKPAAGMERCAMRAIDLVQCEWDVPDPCFQHALFETTSLGGRSKRYTITKDGRLRRHTSEELGEYKGPRYTQDILLPIHGELRLTSRPVSPRDPTISLVVRFTHGQVASIKTAEQAGRLHDAMWRACKSLPGDYRPWGQTEREDRRAPGGWWADCSSGCRHFYVVQDAGDEHISMDWGICINPKSHRCGLLTFEHQGCPAFEDESDQEDHTGEPRL